MSSSALSTALAAESELGPLKWAHLPPPWLLTLIAIASFFWIRSIYARERGRAGLGPRLLLTALRVLVIFALVLVLGGPFRYEEERAKERPHLVVLVDNSASMLVRDRYPATLADPLLEGGWPDPSARPAGLDEIGRGELVQRFLAPAGERMLREWADRFVLHVFSFDGDWRSLGTTQPLRSGTAPAADAPDAVSEIAKAVRGMTFDGGRTRLGAVLRSAANEFARRTDQRLAGVVLLSDGRDTSDGEPPLQVLAGLGPVREELRVLAVGVGNPSSGRNLWVERVRARDVVLVRDQVSFESALRHVGFEGRGPVEAWLDIQQVADASGRTIEPREYKLAAEDSRRTRTRIERLPAEDAKEAAEVRLMAPFNEAGTFRVNLRVRFERQEDAREDSVPEDDVSTHEVRVVDQRIKVLYVDNLPRHDWRFLSNYLTREPGVDATSRISEARSRFEVQVLLQSADPLFEQPHSHGTPALTAFPRTRRELFAYDVVILGDVDWRRLDRRGEEESRGLLKLLADFVEEGGGLALQAGVDYRNPLDLVDTPLGPLLPIQGKVADKKASERFDQPFRIELTDAGVRHPIFSIVPGRDGGLPGAEEIAAIWRGDDALSREWQWWWMYRAQDGLRPGAVDLARVRYGDRQGGDFLDRRGEPFVVFASMRFGNGWVFWSSLDTISRIRRERRDEIYGAFWEQVIRYLATYRLLGGNKRFKITSDKDSYFVGETAALTITALDETFEPLDTEWLDGLSLEEPDAVGGTGIRLLEGDQRPRSLKEEGLRGTYRLDVPLRRKGTVRAWIEGRAEGGAGRRGAERAEKRIEVSYRAREDILKVPDHDALLEIARMTQPAGTSPKVLTLPQLETAVRALEARPREKVLRRDEKSQWDRTWVLLLITGLLALEWLLRKRYQMI